MIECGNVLWLRVRFNNSGVVSATIHPYLVLKKHTDINAIEVGQMDSLGTKGYKVTFKSNQLVKASGETVINQDGFLQKDNKFYIEVFDGLEKYLRTNDKMTTKQFRHLKEAYEKYQREHHISENKIVFLNKTEIEELNC